METGTPAARLSWNRHRLYHWANVIAKLARSIDGICAKWLFCGLLPSGRRHSNNSAIFWALPRRAEFRGKAASCRRPQPLCRCVERTNLAANTRSYRGICLRAYPAEKAGEDAVLGFARESRQRHAGKCASRQGRYSVKAVKRLPIRRSSQGCLEECLGLIVPTTVVTRLSAAIPSLVNPSSAIRSPPP